MLEDKEVSLYAELGGDLIVDQGDWRNFLGTIMQAKESDIQFVRLEGKTATLVLGAPLDDFRMCCSIGCNKDSLHFMRLAFDLTARKELKPIFAKMMVSLFPN